jgi:hypothetical protein
MLAHSYFQLVDDIIAADTDEQVDALRARVAAIALHPLERRALERQLRSREQTLVFEL